MSYQEHLKMCSYCSKNNPQKPTVRFKAASSYRREKKLAERMSVIKGVSYPSISYIGTKTKTNVKGASSSSIEKSQKLKELAKLIRG